MSRLYAVVRASDTLKTGFTTEIVTKDYDLAYKIYHLWKENEGLLPNDREMKITLTELKDIS